MTTHNIPLNQSVLAYLRELGPGPALAALRASYTLFVRAYWESAKITPRLCRADIEMVKLVEHGPDNMGILAPRGVGKTNIVGATLPAYSWFCNPETRVLIPSKSSEHATAVTSLVKNRLETIEFLRYLAPREGQKNTEKMFDVGGASKQVAKSMKAVGMTGQITGSRGHVIIPDDVETPQNTLTLEARDHLERNCSELAALIYIVDESDQINAADYDPRIGFQAQADGIRRRIVYLGTRHHDTDCLYDRLARKGYRFYTIPLLYPELSEINDFEGLAPFIIQDLQEGRASPGDIVFSPRIGPKHVATHQAEGRRYFDMQQMLRKNVGGSFKNPLRLDDLIVMPVDAHSAPVSVTWGTRDHNGSTALDDIPTIGLGSERLHRPIAIDKDRLPYQRNVAWLDPAGLGSDEMACASVGLLAGRFHVKGVKAVHVKDFIPHDLAEGQTASALDRALDQIVLFLRNTATRELFWEDNIDNVGAFGSAITHAIHRHTLEPGQDPIFPDGWSCRCTPVHSNALKITTAGGDTLHNAPKNARIIAVLEPLLSRHRIVIDPSALLPDSTKEADFQLQHQLSRLSAERKSLRKDDRIDALSSAIAMLTDAFTTNPDTSPKRLTDREALKAIKKRSIQRAIERGAYTPDSDSVFKHRRTQ